MRITTAITYTLSILLCLASCRAKEEPFVFPDACSLESIEQRGVLNVCSYYNTTDYYVYKGIAKGFHYELVKQLADHLGVKLNIEVSSNIEESIQKLNDGKYDLIAMSLSITDDRKEKVKFIEPLFNTRRVLIQNNQGDSLVRDIQGLQGKEIFIQKGTSEKNFLEKLNKTHHLCLKITEMDDLSYEDILLEVEKGQLPYTVIDQNVAQIAAKSMTHIDYAVELSGDSPVAWAVNENANLLSQEINSWLNPIKNGDMFNVLYNRYFKSNFITPLHNSKYYKLKNGTISSFDTMIKKEASIIGWDWRLLAAIIYQESGFDPEVTSHQGAIGLMQIMPETSLQLGFKKYVEPKDNIRVGAYYLKYLASMFDQNEVAPMERIKFTLAAYNAGPGHVFDAIKLAERHGKNPNVWDNNVDYFLLHKSQPEYYRDSVVRHGYCDGRQSFKFVNEILENYTHYKNTIPK